LSDTTDKLKSSNSCSALLNKNYNGGNGSENNENNKNSSNVN
jgi:hypothetical protein